MIVNGMFLINVPAVIIARVHSLVPKLGCGFLVVRQEHLVAFFRYLEPKAGGHIDRLCTSLFIQLLASIIDVKRSTDTRGVGLKSDTQLCLHNSE